MSELTIYRVGKFPPVEASSGKEWQFKISIVKAHIGRSSGRSDWQIYPPKLGRSPQLSIDPVNTVTPNLADLLADLTPPKLSIDALNTITLNLADLPPIEASCGKE